MAADEYLGEWISVIASCPEHDSYTEGLDLVVVDLVVGLFAVWKIQP